MSKKTRRVRWEVRFRKRSKDWGYYRGSAFFGARRVKTKAVAGAAWACRSRLEILGELSELTIKRKDNTIQDKRTYGRDPRGIKG